MSVVRLPDINYPDNCPDTNMAAENCHAKFNWGQFPPIWVNERSQENPLLSRTVRNCSRVEGSRNPNTRNQLHPFRCLATIHERYRQTDIWIYCGIDPTYKIGLTGKSNTRKWKCNLSKPRAYRDLCRMRCLRCLTLKWNHVTRCQLDAHPIGNSLTSSVTSSITW